MFKRDEARYEQSGKLYHMLHTTSVGLEGIHLEFAVFLFIPLLNSNILINEILASGKWLGAGLVLLDISW